MSATPPRARIKYSRETPSSRRFGGGLQGFREQPEESANWSRALRFGILAGGLLGAALFVIAEFLTLYAVHTHGSNVTFAAISTHAHDFYALIPIALLVAVFAVAAALLGSRLALLGLTALAIVALGIALIGDLPDAQTTGVVIDAGRYQSATSTASTGFYLETLGAVLLMVVAGCGLLLAGLPRRARQNPDTSTPG